MRGSKQGLTLRKGIIEEKIFPGHYSVRDSLDNSLMTMSLSGKLRMINFDIEIGETVYLVVSIYDLSKGKIALEGHRGGLEMFMSEKALLDRNINPLDEI